MGQTNQVNVDIVAQIAGFKAALAEAGKATENFASSVKAHIESLGTPFTKFNTILAGVAAIAAGGIFKKVIDETVDAALETNKLAKSFGISLTAASELRVGLTLAGTTADEYTQAALRLDRQVRTNADTLERHGLKIKDSNGKLLDQQTLMRNAAKFLLTFEEGTQRNIASQAIFGRGVSLSAEKLERLAQNAARAKKDVADLGLEETAADIAAAKDYKKAIAELGLSFQGIGRTIGREVLPYLTDFSNWFREQTPAIIAGIKTAIHDVVEAFFDGVSSITNLIFDLRELIAKLKQAFVDLGTAIKISFDFSLPGQIVQGIELLKKLKEAGAGSSDRVLLKPNAQFLADRGALAGDDALERLNSGKMLTGAKSAATELSEEVKKEIEVLEDLRKDWIGRIANLKDTVLRGRLPPLTLQGIQDAVNPPGRNDADKLNKNGDRKDDQIAKLRQERIKSMNEYELELESEKNKELLDIGRITNEQFLGMKLSIQQRLNAVDQDALTKERDIYKAHSVEWERAENARVKASQKGALEIERINHQMVMDTKRVWDDVLFNPLLSAWDSHLKALLSKTETFKTAMKQIFGDLLIHWIQMVEKKALTWIEGVALEALVTKEGEAAKTAAVAVGVSARTGAEQAGMLSTIGTRIASVLSSIYASAAEVFANLAAWFSALGPWAIPAAAAGAAGVTATAIAMLPSRAIGDWRVPHDMPIMAHRGEMIVPEQGGFANAVRAALSGNRNAGNGGGVVISPTINHYGNWTTAQAKTHAETIAGFIADVWARNPSLRPAY